MLQVIRYTTDAPEQPRSAHKSMSVDLIYHTGKGTGDPWYSASLMIWTKRTRIDMSPGGLEEILDWPEARKIEELEYMARTIPSSWEFCDFTFLIRNVTRAFTHQLVRTRTMSFAQQTMQVLDMSQGPGWDCLIGPSLTGKQAETGYRVLLDEISDFYARWVGPEGQEAGVRIEDVRGILPTNILTNIVAKGNLRSFCDLIRKRSSPRNTGEFPDVIRAMRARMLEALPWTEIFLNREADQAAAELYRVIRTHVPPGRERNDAVKLVDQLLTDA
jgi:hypothetical protein